jgi:tetratricopeptide (TPR) repeat protein
VRVAIVALVAVLGCRPGPEAAPLPASDARDEETPPVATSLLGKPLYPVPIPDDVRRDHEAKLAAAQAAFEADRADLDSVVWLGRRLAYLGRYREAIDVFTAGLREHPNAPELHRHRGHRYITLRRLEEAVADLQRAAELVEGMPDAVEEDGLPNAAGVPTGTRKTNVFYHLGLAHYLRGELEPAARAYRACLAAATTDDMRVAVSHWLYMTLRRLGRDDEAAAVLEPIAAKMTLYENFAYHRLLLMYRGEVSPETLIGSEADAIERATLGYGLGTWHLVHRRADEARAAFEAVLRTENWSAFGFIAAEAELARG